MKNDTHAFAHGPATIRIGDFEVPRLAFGAMQLPGPTKTAAFSSPAMLGAGFGVTDHAPYVVSTGAALYFARFDPSKLSVQLMRRSLTTPGTAVEVMKDVNGSIGNPVVSADEKTFPSAHLLSTTRA